MDMFGDIDLKYTFYTSRPQTEKYKCNFVRVGESVRIMPHRPLPPGFSVDVDSSEINFMFIVTYYPVNDDVVRANLKGGVFEIRIKYGMHEITINLELGFFDAGVEAPSGFDCDICSEEFDELTRIPKILSCGHTVCAKCLKNMEEKSIPNDDPFDAPIPFLCPQDRSRITCTASELKTNFTLLNLIRAKKEKEAEEKRCGPKLVLDPDVPCYESPDHESDVYCEACEETYCTFCFTKAHSNKKMSAHKSIPVENKPQKIPSCPVHSEKVALKICVEANCTSAHKLFCYLCQRDKLHKGHRYKTLETLIESNKQELQKIVDSQDLSTITEKYEHVQKCFPTFGIDSVSVNKARAQIEQYYDQQKRSDLYDFEEWAKRYRRCMSDVKKDLEDDKEAVSEIHKEAQKILKRKENFYDVGDLLERSAKRPKTDDTVDQFRPMHHFDFSEGMKYPPKVLWQYRRIRFSREETPVEDPAVDDNERARPGNALDRNEDIYISD